MLNQSGDLKATFFLSEKLDWYQRGKGDKGRMLECLRLVSVCRVRNCLVSK